jgi:type III restriction protein res subunit
MLSDVPLRDGLTNMTICITGLGTTKSFSVLMTNAIPDVQLQMNGQCFPMFLYETEEA